MPKRQIVHIDEQLCNGCGICVTPCAEGAIQIVNGKARVSDETLCDGAGFCLSVCPTGALTVETRDAPEFDEDKAEARMHERGELYIAQTCFRCNRGEHLAPLLPIRHKGQSLWVCTGCLPALIHG